MKSKETECTISSLSEEGSGVAFIDGKKVEIAKTYPGDKVKIRYSRRGKGQLLEFLELSPNRATPLCRHFYECGGCKTQQIPYNEQLTLKHKWIENLFHPHPVQSVLPSEPWGYRNKMEFSFSSDKKGERYLGLMMENGRGKVVNLTECHLVSPWFIEVLSSVRKWWIERGLDAYHPHKNTGSLRTLTVREGRHTQDRMVMLTVSGVPEYALKREDLDLFADTVKAVDPSKTWSIFLRIQQAIKGQPTEFFEMALYGPEFYREELHMDTVLKLSVSPTAFFQPNTLQAEVLYKIALNMIPQPEGKVFYDLYAGTGTLGLAIASVAAQVIAIELSPESSLDARENAKANKLSNYRCYTGDVGSVLKEKRGELPLPDAVVVDPPRAGLNPEAIEQIAELKAPYIIYIACNPATQAMNCREFMEKGYQIVKIQPIDQFPQTPHCENIVFLAKEVF